jgi:tRNA A58 N-methylase Trm61
MSERFHFDAGAAGYDRGFGSVSPKFIPALLRTAKLTAGQQVLDVATGSGLAAQAACGIVGPSGHVVATDISAPILDQARPTCGVGERVTGDRRWSSSEFPRGELRRGAMQHGLN